MDTQQRLFPIGIQTFADIRNENYLYIDKTEYVYRMTHSGARYIFLSRPRRFGKSLLVSTLHSYFEGRRELFQGLAIEALEKDWTVYPVLHFDMSMAKHMEKKQLESMLNLQLLKYENIYGKVEDETGLNDRLAGIIQRACTQTGQKVVVLIDEYDAPLLDVVHEDTTLPVLRNVMRNFYSPLKACDPYLRFVYSPLKACDPYLRFVFMTGITKFSQLSIFSELNNIENISMLEQYAAVCGITEEEILTQMSPDLDILAGRLGLSREDTFARLKAKYDGYHFTWPSPDIYNPFSLIRAFANAKLDSYWFGSGTPTYLIEMIRKFRMTPIQLGETCKAGKDEFDTPTERLSSIIPLLYQSGIESYTLGIPNQEVRIGLFRSLIPYYVTPDTISASSTLITMAECLLEDDMDGALKAMQTFLGTVPYTDNSGYEGHWQQVLYIIFSLLGYYAGADAAMQQIDLKQYPERFALCGLPVVKVAIDFDREAHNISGWKISQ